MTGIGLICNLRLSYLTTSCMRMRGRNFTAASHYSSKKCVQTTYKCKIEHKYSRCCVFCCPFKTVQCLLCAKSVWLQCLLCAKSPGVFGFMCSFTPMLLLCGTFNYNMVDACYFSTECNTHICTLRCLYMLLILVLKEHAQAH